MAAAVTGPEGLWIKLIPYHFIIHRIHTDDQRCQVFQHAKGRRSTDAVCDSGLTISIDPLIRIDAAKDWPKVDQHGGIQITQHHVDVRNLHRKMHLLFNFAL